MEQLRRHCSAEISALEESVGSQQQLVAALRHTYPEQVHTHTHLHLHAVHLVSLSVNYLNNLNVCLSCFKSTGCIKQDL